MGYLGKVKNWDNFRKQLRTLKKGGFEGITTDIWWGYVATEGGWDYYKKLLRIVREEGLNVIIGAGNHAAEKGNSGDTEDIPLPERVWSQDPDLQFVSGTGFRSKEVLRFLNPKTYELTKEFLQSVKDNLQEFNDIIVAIDLDLGPSGELRFPSYTTRDHWKWPDLGILQIYSDADIKLFRKWLLERHEGSFEKLKEDLHLTVSSIEEIYPPRDGERFFRTGYKTAYGQSFLQFQQWILEEHFKKYYQIAHEVFKEGANPFHAFFRGKAPLIHWKRWDPRYPRSAEYAAGWFDYRSLIKLFTKLGVVFTYTGLDIVNENKFPVFGAAEELIKEVGEIIKEEGTRYATESAGEQKDDEAVLHSILNTRDAFLISPPIEIHSIFRINALVNEDGSPKPAYYAYLDTLMPGHPPVEKREHEHPKLLARCRERLQSYLKSLKDILVEN